MPAIRGIFNLGHQSGMQVCAKVASALHRELAMAFLWALALSLP